MIDLSRFFLQSREVGFVTDPRGTILLVTGGTEQALGRSSEELKGTNLADLVEGGELGEFFTREHLEPAGLYVDLRLRDREGGLLKLHAAAFALVTESGEPEGWFFGVRDMPGPAVETRRDPEILGALADSVGASFWSLDAGGTILTCGGACNGYFGIPCEEAEGKLEASQLFADPGRLREILAEVDRHGRFAGEALLVARGGGVRVNHVLVTRLSSEPVRYSCVSFDITEQRRDEEFHRVLFEKAGSGILVVDGETLRVTAANDRAGRLLGYPNEELVNLSFMSLQPSFDAENARRALDKVEAEGEGLFEALWCLRKDGQAFPAHMSMNRAVVSGRKLLVCVFQDITERVRASTELQEARVFLERFRDEACDAIGILDAGGGIVYVNEQACRLLGRSRKELLGATFVLAAPPERLAEQQEILTHVMAGERMRFRTELARPDGTHLHVEVHAAPLEVRGQRYASTFVRDITEEVRAEEALRGSEARWRSLVENAPDIILTVDREGKILSLNRGIASGENLLGRSHYEFIHPDDRALARSAQEWVFRSAQPLSYEVRGSIPGGGTRWYASRVSPILQGDEVEGLTIIATDVTEQREAQEEMQFRKTLLESQMEAALDGILVVNAEGRIISFNRRFVEMWGIPEDVMERRSDEEAIQAVLGKLVLPKKFLDRVKRLYAFPDERARDELELKDGRTFDRYTAPVRGTDGVLYGRIWCFRDITEQKSSDEAVRKAYAALKRAQAQLVRSEKLASVGMLMSGVAHEINNPLSVIYGNLKLFMEEPGGTSRQREMLQDALSASERARGIVEEFRLFARGSRAEEPVDLNRCLKEALAVARREFPPGIRVTKRLGRIPPVSGFSGQLNQVFFNLLKNSGEAITGRGTISLRSRVRAGRAVIEVGDTGRGMKESVRQQLFEPFFTTKPEGKGLGLGLSISAMIVQNHSGEITVRSRVGKGSVFRVEIPLAKEPR